MTADYMPTSPQVTQTTATGSPGGSIRNRADLQCEFKSESKSEFKSEFSSG